MPKKTANLSQPETKRKPNYYHQLMKSMGRMAIAKSIIASELHEQDFTEKEIIYFFSHNQIFVAKMTNLLYAKSVGKKLK